MKYLFEISFNHNIEEDTAEELVTIELTQPQIEGIYTAKSLLDPNPYDSHMRITAFMPTEMLELNNFYYYEPLIERERFRTDRAYQTEMDEWINEREAGAKRYKIVLQGDEDLWVDEEEEEYPSIEVYVIRTNNLEFLQGVLTGLKWFRKDWRVYIKHIYEEDQEVTITNQ